MLNRRVDLHAIDATSAPWRGPAGPSPLDGASTAASSPRNEFVKNHRVHPTHLLISTQLVAVDERPVFRKRALVAGAPALEAIKPLPSAAADDGRHRWIWSLAVAVIGTRELYVVVLACVEINQCVRCTFLDDDAAVLAPSSARNRHRHAIEQASRRWRGGRRDDSARTRRKILISTQVFTAPRREAKEDDEIRKELAQKVGH